MAEVILYQVINLDREEMFFGTTELELSEEIGRLSQLKDGPMAEWKEGELLQWRPLTPKVEESVAKSLHQEIQKKTPPNEFHVIQT